MDSSPQGSSPGTKGRPRQRQFKRTPTGGRSAKGSLLGTGGQPPRYKTVEEFSAAIDRYFADCEANKTVMTMTGLMLAIGFSDRESLLRYGNKGEQYADVVKKARNRIIHQVETFLLTKQSPVGAIFWLKNNGKYVDKSEVEHSGTVTMDDQQMEERIRYLLDQEKCVDQPPIKLVSNEG